MRFRPIRSFTHPSLPLPAVIAVVLGALSSIGCSSSEEPATASANADAAPIAATSGGAVTPSASEERAPVRGDMPSPDVSRGADQPDRTAERDEAAPDERTGSTARPAKRRASAAKEGPRDRAGDATQDQQVADADEAGKLTVKRLVIATDVADREPLHPTTVISKAATEKVYAFVEVHNPSRGQSELEVMFHPPTRPAFPVALSIGALERYRTWAYTRKLDDLGTWRVEVKSGAGDVLASSTFQLNE